ncbi:MAG: ATP synthase subunit a [bacterium]|nr:ATP synthase subunit a [bacterium]
MNKGSVVSNLIKYALVALVFSCAWGPASWGQAHSEPAVEPAAHQAAGDDALVGAHSVGETHEAGHGEQAAHAEGEHHEEHPPEIPDLLFLIQNSTTNPSLKKFIGAIRVPFYSILIACVVAFWFKRRLRKTELIPGRGQVAVEMYVELLDEFVCGTLGKERGRQFLPFIGTVAVYIWCMNLSCLIPGLVPPTSYPTQTFGLSILVFVYVQFTAFRYQGFGGYMFHLANEPRDALGWAMAPLFFPLHIMGELIKPVSLGLRLWGNVLGEDILLGVFSGLGIMLVPAITALVGWHIESLWVGIPLHLLVIPLVLLGSTVQALVFTALSTIYFSLVLPHHDHSEHHAPAGAH